jgi:ribosomal protein S18 acetylase RimI-like enzyme
VRGPLVREPRRLDALLPLVGPTLEAALPDIEQFNAFAAADGSLLNDWYAAAGYERHELHRVLRTPTGTLPTSTPSFGPTAAGRARAPDLPAALQLHQELFPSAYIGEADFRRAVDALDCALFVVRARDDATCAGYLYVQDDKVEQEAYIDYLGVRPVHRGQGLGRALLDAAMRWAAGQRRGHIALTVREDRRSAFNLYARTGFVEISAGRHWQKVVGLTNHAFIAKR